MLTAPKEGMRAFKKGPLTPNTGQNNPQNKNKTTNPKSPIISKYKKHKQLHSHAHGYTFTYMAHMHAPTIKTVKRIHIIH